MKKTLLSLIPSIIDVNFCRTKEGPAMLRVFNSCPSVRLSKTFKVEQKKWRKLSIPFFVAKYLPGLLLGIEEKKHIFSKAKQSAPNSFMKTHLDQFGPFWTNLDKFGPIWMHFDSFIPNLDHFEPF